MEKIMLNRDEYDKVVDEYRTRHGYDDMTDEEKGAFDERLDQAVGVKEDDDEDQTEGTEASEPDANDQFRKEMKEKYGYSDMSDEEKADFDSKLDSVLGNGDGESLDTMDDENTDPYVRKLVR